MKANSEKELTRPQHRNLKDCFILGYDNDRTMETT